MYLFLLSSVLSTFTVPIFYNIDVESVLLFDNKSNDILGQINNFDILLFLIFLHRNSVESNSGIPPPWNITLSNWIGIFPLI